MKKYSIVIITYQGKDLVINTLESLRYQRGFTREDYEVIVVDDGSVDGTREAVEQRYKDLCKYIFLERCEESCRSRARNIGFKHTEGEYIVFVDGDIIAKENYLQEIDRCLSMDENIMVTGPRIMFQDKVLLDEVQDKSIFNKIVFDRTKEELFEIRDLAFEYYSYNAAAYRYPWLIMFSFSIALHRKWLDKYGGFDEFFKGWSMEDIEIFYRMSKNGVRIVFNSRLEVLHQYHGNHNVTHPSKYPEIERNIDYFYEKHPEVDIPKQEMYDLVKLKTRICLGYEVDASLGTRTIEFRDRQELEAVKNEILTLSGQSGYELIVLDYVEDTDLDVWIQLLGKRNSIPKYYPVSRKIFV